MKRQADTRMVLYFKDAFAKWHESVMIWTVETDVEFVAPFFKWTDKIINCGLPSGLEKCLCTCQSTVLPIDLGPKKSCGLLFLGAFTGCNHADIIIYK